MSLCEQSVYPNPWLRRLWRLCRRRQRRRSAPSAPSHRRLRQLRPSWTKTAIAAAAVDDDRPRRRERRRSAPSTTTVGAVNDDGRRRRLHHNAASVDDDRRRGRPACQRTLGRSHHRRARPPSSPLCRRDTVSIHNLRTVAPRYGELLALLVYLTWLLSCRSFANRHHHCRAGPTSSPLDGALELPSRSAKKSANQQSN